MQLLSDYINWIIFIHIISASAFVMTMTIMQLVVSNVMKRIPESDGKKAGKEFIQKKWRPIVDTIIVLVGVTGISSIIILFDMLGNNPFFQTKIVFGCLSLTAAYLNHFYFRYKKQSIIRTGDKGNHLKKINFIMPVLDKVALICGMITALMGWYMNHV